MRKGCGGGKFVRVDDDGVVRSGIVAAVTTIALSCDEFGNAIAIDVDQGERVRLREGFVDGMAYPYPVRRCPGLLQPVETIAVALAVDQIHLAIVVYVVAENGKAGVCKVPVRVPHPLIVVCVD